MDHSNRTEFIESVVTDRLGEMTGLVVLPGFNPAKLDRYPSPWAWVDISDGAPEPVLDASGRPIPRQKRGSVPFKVYMGKKVTSDIGDAALTLRTCWQMQWELETLLESRVSAEATIENVRVSVHGLALNGFTCAPDDERRLAMVMVTGTVYFTQHDIDNTDF